MDPLLSRNALSAPFVLHPWLSASCGLSQCPRLGSAPSTQRTARPRRFHVLSCEMGTVLGEQTQGVSVIVIFPLLYKRDPGRGAPSPFYLLPRPVSHLSYFFPLWDRAAQHRSDRTKPNLSFRTGPWAWSFHQPLKLEAAVGLLKRSSFPVLHAPPWSYFT